MRNIDENQSLKEIFVFETSNMLERLEEIFLEEKESYVEEVNEIFRVLHTIKGASAMMGAKSLADLSHVLEDIFAYIRSDNPQNIDYRYVGDLILKSVDNMKDSLEKIEKNLEDKNYPQTIIDESKQYLEFIKQIHMPSYVSEKVVENINPEEQNSFQSELPISYKMKINITFQDGCEMENIRAYAILHKIKEYYSEVASEPSNIEDEASIKIIKEKGIDIFIGKGVDISVIEEIISSSAFIESYKIAEALTNIEDEPIKAKLDDVKDDKKNNINKDINLDNSGKSDEKIKESKKSNEMNKMISVNVSKLDNLMNLVGELVIAESMVTQHPEIKDLQIDGLLKSATRLRKIISDIQNEVMSIRMVALNQTFQKMKRLVRDTSKSLDKEIELIISGGDVEVDKNVAERISDPLMHIIRNSIDHGIESESERLALGKKQQGKIYLKAENTGGSVQISIEDDGKGLDKEKIFQKALEKGLINGDLEELTDKDVYTFIFKPGFSTKQEVTDLSGRGVGMDVVNKNIEQIRGKVIVDSEEGKGTTVILNIPLTLAIIDGMLTKTSNGNFVVPTTKIKKSLRVNPEDIIFEPKGKKYILERNKLNRVIDISELYGFEDTKEREKIGIIIETEEKSACILVDEILGQHQIVIKELPNHIKGVKAVNGCTLLGDGSISLILDIDKILDL